MGCRFGLAVFFLLFIWELTTLVWFVIWRLLNGHHGPVPFLSLSRMVIFSCLLKGCFALGGLDTVRVTKVKGHADEVMVLEVVRERDRLGNNAAGEAGLWS